MLGQHIVSSCMDSILVRREDVVLRPTAFVARFALFLPKKKDRGVFRVHEETSGYSSDRTELVRNLVQKRSLAWFKNYDKENPGGQSFLVRVIEAFGPNQASDCAFCDFGRSECKVTSLCFRIPTSNLAGGKLFFALS